MLELQLVRELAVVLMLSVQTTISIVSDLTFFPKVVRHLMTYLIPSSDMEVQDASVTKPHPPQDVPRTSSQGKVNPYSVIEITPLQLQQHEQHRGPPASASSPTEPKDREEDAQDFHASPVGITSGYSVPVPCGYATPSGVPLITPAYTTPVIIRHLSMDEDGKAECKINVRTPIRNITLLI